MYCAIAYYKDTALTNSVYVCNIDNFKNVAMEALTYFPKKVMGKEIDRIEILPRDFNRYDTVEPVATYKVWLVDEVLYNGYLMMQV